MCLGCIAGSGNYEEAINELYKDKDYDTNKSYETK